MEFKTKIDYFLSEKKYQKKTNMCQLFEKNKSDKSTWHNYTTLYDILFSEYIGKNINFFELGLGTNNLDVPSNMGSNARPGSSLYAFREYFKDANICGADIDQRVLFTDENIWTFYVDQKRPEEIKDLWDSFEDTKFDIIIDDGLHEYNANITFFENSINMLMDGGIYIIEDIKREEKDIFEKYFSELNYSYSSVLEIPIEQEWADEAPYPWKGKLNVFDNIVGIIQK